MHFPHCDVVHIKGFVDFHTNKSYKQGDLTNCINCNTTFDGTGCPVHVWRAFCYMGHSKKKKKASASQCCA